MSCSLDLHKSGYNLSLADLLTSVRTKFSGEPYAKRHRELARHNPHHKVIANLQEIPYLGCLLAIFERLSMVEMNGVFHRLELAPSLQERVEIQNLHWTPRSLSVDQAMQKMWKNTHKAILEHNKKEDVYIKDIFSIQVIANAPLEPLTATYNAAIAQGIRPSMEDAHLIMETPQAVMGAVFDGHGGDEVAKYACFRFQERFFSSLEENEGHIYQSFERLIHEIQEDIAQHREWDTVGSTALICYIDKETHLIYTATLGDSEANIYRKVDSGRLQSIPLSCVRDWSSKKDAHRVALVKQDICIDMDWVDNPQPKLLRYPGGNTGLNVSRSFGDMQYHPVVSHKPKITVNQLKPGDLLILACDGLKDYVSEKEIIEQLIEHKQDLTVSEQLVRYALYDKRSTDNITVVAIHL